MTGVIWRSMMVRAFESVFHHSRYAVSSSGVEAAVGICSRSRLDWEGGEWIGIALGVTPVALTLKNLADASSPGVVVRRACKEFDMIKFDSSHNEIRDANTVGTIIICTIYARLFEDKDPRIDTRSVLTQFAKGDEL